MSDVDYGANEMLWTGITNRVYKIEHKFIDAVDYLHSDGAPQLVNNPHTFWKYSEPSLKK